MPAVPRSTMAPWCPMSIVDTPASAKGQGRTEVPISLTSGAGGRRLGVGVSSTEGFFALAERAPEPAIRAPHQTDAPGSLMACGSSLGADCR